MTLQEFILARYDDIEQVAQAASPGPWSPDADGTEVLAEDGITVAEGFALSGPQLRATVQHIALNDPAYVLADLAAKRFVVDTLRSYESSDEWDTEPDMGKRKNNAAGALRRMALPFASHPDYDPSWRPS